MEYVPGTLTVDGASVSDAEDTDQGHVANGQVIGQFGNVTDTEWHTVQFHVTVAAGQASKDIVNVAVVSGDNVPVPNQPREEVQIYPRHAVLESEKTAANLDAAKDRFEVGDTVVYTIRTRNTIADSSVTNLTITDQLPAGLTYVEDSLEISNGGTGSFTNGTIAASFGNVTDTEWRTVTFRAVIEAGYAGETLVNIATIDGDNLDVPDKPQSDVKVEPKAPILAAEKAATLLSKANGNNDQEHPEVGDTLLYTIQARNIIPDSLVENLVISDKIPDGLEYVPGTLKVNGVAVSDAEDTDQGHYTNGQVVGQFGNITDTEWHTVQFHVTVAAGQASKDIVNVAVVSGDNVPVPNQPREEVQIYPRHAVLESEKTAANLDAAKNRFEVGDTVVYTIRTRNTIPDSSVTNLTITDQLPQGLTYVEDSLEINNGGTGSFTNGTITASFGNVTDIEWRTVTFRAVIEAGYAGETLVNIATIDGDNLDVPDKPQSDVKVEPKAPILAAEKAATLLSKANGNTDQDHPEVGDTLLYTIQARNIIPDSLVENLVISDKIPDGLEYVPGTLKVNGVAVSDAEDTDQGHYTNGQVVGQFGNVTDTEWHTVQFHVTVAAGQASKDIVNVAVVSGDNVPVPNQPREEVQIYPRHAVLESEKTAANLDAAKDRFEVGDTVVYTIRTRNTIVDSSVTNLTITDQLPAGLTYVEDSLEISNGGTGSFTNGTIAASFGNVADTEWRTITFRAVIEAGYAGETLVNIATIDGDNLDVPDKPQSDVKVEPKAPILAAEKAATLLSKANGNTDQNHPEVGDTLLYTIQARNIIPNSLIENLVITDKIPDGLEYVPGTLKVNGVAVSDAEDTDQGHYTNGQVVGQFGNVTDTEWHTVQFHVTVAAGQASKDIVNVAVVSGDNVPVPNQPREEVQIYPRHAVLESEKTAANLDAAKDRFEAGDTVVYTIRARNMVTDSTVQNLTITDQLPQGLVFVEDSLEVSNGGTGSFTNGTIAASFGNVTDTEWRTVTFRAIIEANYTGDIKNVAAAGGDNIEEKTSSTSEITVEPKQPGNPEPTEPGGGTEPNEPGDGSTPTEPGGGTEPNEPGDDSTPSEPGDGSEPTEPDDDSTPSEPGDSSEPTEPDDDSTPSEPNDSSDKSDPDGASNRPDPKDSTSTTDPGKDTTTIDDPKGHKLPNTATNLFNLAFVGIIILLFGLFLRRRKKV